MGKKIIIGIVIIIIVAFIGYKFIYKEHRDIGSEDAAFTLTTSQLQQEFSAGDSLANAKYADQTIQVEGTITSVDPIGNSIVIDQKLSAVLKDKLTSDISANKPVKVKGRFVGYDDLLEELKMDQVSIIK
ncbi:MAG TPA: hypothetical protein VGB43_02840 [Flavobacterium sp.]|jgi:hypothetical protein